jgi:hypothetical protein
MKYLESTCKLRAVTGSKGGPNVCMTQVWLERSTEEGRVNPARLVLQGNIKSRRTCETGEGADMNTPAINLKSITGDKVLGRPSK